MPPRMPPQRFVSVTTFPPRSTKASLFSLPRSAAEPKPAPNSTPFTAGMPNSAAERRLSTPSNSASPSPAGTPSTAHSTMPPTLSPSARALAMASSISSPRFSLSVGNGFPSVDAGKSPSSATPAIEAMCETMRMPRRSKSCMAMPPATHSGAVSRPEKRPPPERSTLSPSLMRAVKSA